MFALAARLCDPWEGYAPTPPLTRFHSSDARHRYLRAASQAGKTMGCAREAWMYAGDCHPFRVVPRKAKFGLIAVGSLEGTPLLGVLKALWETRPEHLIDWELTKWTGPTHLPPNGMFYMKNGSSFKIVSSRGGSTGAASVQADWVWIDEPPKKDKFGELVARVTQTDGHIWLSFTPLDSEQDLTWLKLYLEGDPERGKLPEAPGWEGTVMALSVESCPWMRQDAVDAVWANTPLWIAEQRLKGGWDSPPVDAYFQLDANVHDISVPFDTQGLRVGAWRPFASADHGELAGHQHVVFNLMRKCAPEVGPVFAQVATVGEYVSTSRSSFEEDAAGIKGELFKLARNVGGYLDGDFGYLAQPGAWTWTGDVNTAGKGMAGVTANEALAMALGLRRDIFTLPDKSAGSVANGLVLLKSAIDKRPSQVRIASGSTGNLSAHALWKAVTRHKGKADDTKHALDAWRYGICPFLEDGALAVRQLPEPPRRTAFATPLRG